MALSEIIKIEELWYYIFDVLLRIPRPLILTIFVRFPPFFGGKVGCGSSNASDSLSICCLPDLEPGLRQHNGLPISY